MHALPGDLPVSIQFAQFQIFNARTFQQVGVVALPKDRGCRIVVGADAHIGNADLDIFAAVAHGCLVADPLFQVHSLGAEIRGIASAISGRASGFPTVHPVGDQLLDGCCGFGWCVRDLSRRTGGFLNNRRRDGFVIQDKPLMADILQGKPLIRTNERAFFIDVRDLIENNHRILVVS